MPITLNGSGTVSGISAGGLPDGIIQSADLATGVGGKILQVVSTTKTDAASQALTGSGNFFDISGMSVSITPSSSSNKVLVMTTVAVACNDADQNNFIRLRRDSTDIALGLSLIHI